MKKMKLWMLTAILTLCGAMNTGAQTSSDSIYVVAELLPNAVHFLPAPPDSSSAAFLDDVAQWQWSKSMALTERGARASVESRQGLEALASIMAQVLEIDTISAEETPALCRLLLKSLVTGVTSTKKPKLQYQRKRAEYEGVVTTGIAPETPVAQPSSIRAYRLDGTPATDDTRGIIIENQQKIFRR